MKRVVKTGQIWKNPETGALIRILEQTRFHRRTAHFNTTLIDNHGKRLETEPDELPEDYILEFWKMHKDVYNGPRR